MSKNDDLVAEVRAALVKAQSAEAAYIGARALAHERRQEWTAARELVAEIEEEILTGKTDRGIIDKVGTMHTSEPANGTGAAHVAEANAARDRSELSDLLHESGNGDTFPRRKRARKAVAP